MRIEAYTQVQQLYQPQKVKRNQQTGSSTAVDQSQAIQISSIGKDFQTAKAAVASAPDIREELTAPIKARIDSGTYAVAVETFADKLLQKYEEMR